MSPQGHYHVDVFQADRRVVRGFTLQSCEGSDLYRRAGDARDHRGIVYGAMLACLLPELRLWWAAPTRLVASPSSSSPAARAAFSAMAAGVFLSGIRDLCAAAGLPGSAWPWARRETAIQLPR